MKRKNMIMVGLLVLVCVLFLAVGYAGITKTITLRAGIGGYAKSSNFKIGYSYSGIVKRESKGLTYTTYLVEEADDGAVFLDENEEIFTKMSFQSYGLNTKGDYVTIYIPVINVSNGLDATKFSITTPKFSGDTSKNCEKYYSIETKLLKYNEGDIDKAASYIEMTSSDVLKPFTTLDEAKEAKGFALLKLTLSLKSSLAEDTMTSSTGSFFLSNYCQWTVDVQAEATANVD